MICYTLDSWEEFITEKRTTKKGKTSQKYDKRVGLPQDQSLDDPLRQASGMEECRACTAAQHPVDPADQVRE